MLGKGLESLIPPKNAQDGNGGDDGQIFPVGNQGGFRSDSIGISAANDADLPPKILHDHDKEMASMDERTVSSAEASLPRIKNKSKKTSVTANEFDGLTATEDHIFHIEVEKIKPNPNQPRRDFNEAGLQELAHSIREFGFLQPLVVSKIEHETDKGLEVEYQLIAGERRLHAAKILGLRVVPAIVRNVNLEREKLEMAMIENIQRENLNPIETARAFARLQDEFRLTQREIAAKLGKSREVVANTVRLLSLPIYIQESLEKGHLSESHGRLLLSIEDVGAQKKLFDDILAHGMTTRELKIRVQASRPIKSMPHEALSPELKMMEEKLSTDLGTPVRIEKSAGTGKVIITFYSEEELENIVHKIGKEDHL